MSFITAITIAGMTLLAIVSVWMLGPVFGGIVTIAVMSVLVWIGKLIMRRVGDPDDVFALERQTKP